MTTATTLKTGATFSAAYTAKLPAGTWSAEADLRKKNDDKIADLTVTISQLSTPDAVGNTHSGTLSATAAQTALWPVGTHLCDVKFTDGTVAKISDSFAVIVTQAVTHA
jgi:hypothetical protein